MLKEPGNYCHFQYVYTTEVDAHDINPFDTIHVANLPTVWLMTI